MKKLTTILVTLVAFNGFADERDEKILNDFGLAPEPVTIRHVPEAGLETVLNPDGEPIAVKLETGVERRLVFPQPVMVGVENGMTEALRIQNVDRTVFLSAVTAIPHTRLLVRHVDGSRTYVLNVTTEGVSVRHTALMISPDAPAPAVVKTVVPRLNQSVARDQSGYAAYVRLTRYAAQQIYGPARLANTQPSLTRQDDIDTSTSGSLPIRQPIQSSWIRAVSAVDGSPRRFTPRRSAVRAGLMMCQHFMSSRISRLIRHWGQSDDDGRKGNCLFGDRRGTAALCLCDVYTRGRHHELGRLPVAGRPQKATGRS